MAMYEDDEITILFLEEAREHLEGIEADLLSIEAGGENIDEDFVNKVFRSIHSIKGGAGFLGFSNVKQLSHAMENILNMIRNRELIPTTDIITQLLDSADVLKNMINDAKNSNDMDIEDQLALLKNVITETLPEDNKDSVDNMITVLAGDGRTIFQVSEFDLIQSQKGGKHLYLVEYDLIEDIHHKKINTIDVINDLQKTGIFLDSKVDVEAVGKISINIETVKIPFYILFATVMDTDIIGAIVDINPDRIHKICMDDFLGKNQLIVEGISNGKKDVSGKEKAEAVKTPASDVISTGAVNVKVITSEATKEAEPSAEVISTGAINVKVDTSEAVKQPESMAPPKVEPVKKPMTAKSEATKLSASKPKQPKVKPAAGNISPPPVSENFLRVNIKILNTLMTLAGELVLTRNQLLQAVTSKDNQSIETTTQRVDLITAELQEAIMATRMQSVGNVFSKFRRVVRDLSRDLSKVIELTIEGEEVELDKTIIETIGDPLTHLVRNAVDHGLETPDEREKTGKGPTGHIKLKAYHEAGQVIIEVADDGKGIDAAKVKAAALKRELLSSSQLDGMSEKELVNLIFKPGFSMAKEVTDISGRGVGMDVVYTNFTKLGGTVDIETTVGVGSTFRVKLPLTLAIIPSILIGADEEKFAIPQVNLVELVRIPVAQVSKRIEKIGTSLVIRLRGDILPLIKLHEAVGIYKSTYIHPVTGEENVDRRLRVEDRRSMQVEEENKENDINDYDSKRNSSDRRKHSSSAINIVVVAAGDFHYGIIVDNLLDSEEIVVKPLGCHLRECSEYAGATILGDGKVALILDIVGISRKMKLEENSRNVEEERLTRMQTKVTNNENAQSLLVMEIAKGERFAVPLGLISRIERISNGDMELLGGKKVIKYRNKTLQLLSVEDVANINPLADTEHPYLIVFPVSGREVGLIVSQVVDIVDVAVDIDVETFCQQGIMGAVRVLNEITLLIDLHGIIAGVLPDEKDNVSQIATEDNAKCILIVEDSEFFLQQVRGFLSESGYKIKEAHNGVEALEILYEHAEEIDLILTDIEMPEMDGIELTKKIRSDEMFSQLPIIALTSLIGDSATQKGKEAGVDQYLAKLDKENILEHIQNFLQNGRRNIAA